MRQRLRMCAPPTRGAPSAALRVGLAAALLAALATAAPPTASELVPTRMSWYGGWAVADEPARRRQQSPGGAADGGSAEGLGGGSGSGSRSPPPPPPPPPTLTPTPPSPSTPAGPQPRFTSDPQPTELTPAALSATPSSLPPPPASATTTTTTTTTTTSTAPSPLQTLAPRLPPDDSESGLLGRLMAPVPHVPLGVTCDDAGADGVLPLPGSSDAGSASGWFPLHFLVLPSRVEGGRTPGSDTAPGGVPAEYVVLGLRPRAQLGGLPRGDVLHSVDGGASWRCAGVANGELVRAGATAFVVSRLRSLAGTGERVPQATPSPSSTPSTAGGGVVEVEDEHASVCVAGGRPATQQTPYAALFGPARADVMCLSRQSLTASVGGPVVAASGAGSSGGSMQWRAGGALPAAAMGVTHATIPSTESLGDPAAVTLPVWHVLAGGRRANASAAEVWVGVFPEKLDEAEPDLFTVPLRWRAVAVGPQAPRQRAGVLAVWLPAARRLALAGGFGDLDELSRPLVESPSEPESTTQAELLNLATGGLSGDYAYTDITLVDVLPSLVDPSVARTAGTLRMGLSLPVAPTGDAMRAYALTAVPPGTPASLFPWGNDTLLFQSGDAVYTSVTSLPAAASNRLPSERNFLAMRRHTTYNGTVAALPGWGTASSPFRVDPAPASYLGVAVWTATTDPEAKAGGWFPHILAADPRAGGWLYRASFAECTGPAWQAGECALGQYPGVCRTTPFDKPCEPCVVCAASDPGQQPECVRAADPACPVCVPCPAAEPFVQRPCGWPGSPNATHSTCSATPPSDTDDDGTDAGGPGEGFLPRPSRLPLPDGPDPEIPAPPRASPLIDAQAGAMLMAVAAEVLAAAALVAVVLARRGWCASGDGGGKARGVCCGAYGRGYVVWGGGAGGWGKPVGDPCDAVVVTLPRETSRATAVALARTPAASGTRTASVVGIEAVEAPVCVGLRSGGAAGSASAAGGGTLGCSADSAVHPTPLPSRGLLRAAARANAASLTAGKALTPARAHRAGLDATAVPLGEVLPAGARLLGVVMQLTLLLPIATVSHALYVRHVPYRSFLLRLPLAVAPAALLVAVVGARLLVPRSGFGGVLRRAVGAAAATDRGGCSAGGAVWGWALLAAAACRPAVLLAPLRRVDAAPRDATGSNEAVLRRRLLCWTAAAVLLLAEVPLVFGLLLAWRAQNRVPSTWETQSDMLPPSIALMPVAFVLALVHCLDTLRALWLSWRSSRVGPSDPTTSGRRGAPAWVAHAGRPAATAAATVAAAGDDGAGAGAPPRGFSPTAQRSTPWAAGAVGGAALLSPPQQLAPTVIATDSPLLAAAAGGGGGGGVVTRVSPPAGVLTADPQGEAAVSLISQLWASAATPEGRRLAGMRTFFRRHPGLLPAAVAAVARSPLPSVWLRLLRCLEAQLQGSGPAIDAAVSEAACAAAAATLADPWAAQHPAAMSMSQAGDEWSPPPQQQPQTQQTPRNRAAGSAARPSAREVGYQSDADESGEPEPAAP